MINRFTSAMALVALIGSFVAIPATGAFAQGNNKVDKIDKKNTNRLNVPVAGGVTRVVGGVVQPVGTIAGTVAISHFAIQDDKLVAIGQLTGTVTTTAGAVVQTIVTPVTMAVATASGGSPAADAAASCDTAELQLGTCAILNLVLGPLHLDLLGLVIDLNQVVLNITGDTGAGNLLGNLLCSITNLLNGGVLGGLLVDLLNQLIGVLGGL